MIDGAQPQFALQTPEGRFYRLYRHIELPDFFCGQIRSRAFQHIASRPLLPLFPLDLSDFPAQGLGFFSVLGRFGRNRIVLGNGWISFPDYSHPFPDLFYLF